MNAASLKRFIHTVALLALFTTGAFAQTITGVITNKTNNKPAAGDDVVLLKLAQGMQELARATTDSRGHYTLKIPADEATSMHLVRVTHDRATYFKPVPPDTKSIDMDVYTAAATVAGVTVGIDVMQIQTSPDGGQLSVVEHFVVKNASDPAMTLFSEHPFEVTVPAGATVDGSSAKAPGGMAVEQPMVPMADPNHYTILFPIRPGETEFDVFYHVPYKGSLKLQPHPYMVTSTLGIELPASMTFKPDLPTQYTSITEKVGRKMQAYLAENIKPSEPAAFTITGQGQLPRDNVAQGGGSEQAAAAGAAANTQGDPNTDTRPGGGLGTPLDKDADRDPWTKYRWWIIAGLGLALTAAAGWMFRTPTTPLPAAHPLAPHPTTPHPAAMPIASHHSNALQVLRDEMFALETDRLEGRLTEQQYTELKSAYDIVLRRALSRA